jgi:rod shape-determining protein MreD
MKTRTRGASVFRWEIFVPSAIALAVAAVAQVAIAPHMAVFGVVPNFILLVVVTLALVEGPVAGCWAGFAGGILFDLAGDSVVGPSALVLCIIGYAAGMLQANMFAEGWLLPVTVVAVASLFAEVAYGLIMVILDEGTPFWFALGRLMLPAALYNTALAVLAYPFLARLLRQERVVKSFQRLS